MMEAIIVFFRDLLNGPLYTVVFIVCLILILVCISGIKKNILEVIELHDFPLVNIGSISDIVTVGVSNAYTYTVASELGE